MFLVLLEQILSTITQKSYKPLRQNTRKQRISLTKLFGTSGMRGVVNSSITPRLVLCIGQALVTQTKAKSILIGRDTRTTSLMLQQALTAGIAACGANILLHNVIPTPVLAYLTRQVNADAGVMITASHNPPQYNGIKLYNSDTTAYNPTQQTQIEEQVAKPHSRFAAWKNMGKATTIDEVEQYIQQITRNVQFQNSWKIVLDCANGATSQLAPQIFKELECNVLAINSHTDGYFPGRDPEPTRESLKYLTNIVGELHADLGIAFDGDGDRLVTIDEKGRFALLDQTFAAYAAYVLKQCPKNKTIITHVETSMCIEKMIEREGGKVVRTKVGDVNITEAIKHHNAPFGGEPCGAWIHPRYHYCPDGILSSILLIQALEDTNQTLSSFISKVPKYPLLRRNIRCSNSAKSTIVRKISEKLPTIFPDVKDKSEIDGIRLALRRGWLLVRPSGTEPLIRLSVESETRKTAKIILEKASNLIGRLVRRENG
jgi:phosphoglucosamine mutase